MGAIPQTAPIREDGLGGSRARARRESRRRRDCDRVERGGSRARARRESSFAPILPPTRRGWISCARPTRKASAPPGSDRPRPVDLVRAPDEKALTQAIERLEGYDVVVIDTPRYYGNVLIQSALRADLIVLP